MNSASDLAEQVMLNLTGCPEPVAMQALRKAFGRLCRETKCWRSSFTQTLSADPTEANDDWLELDLAQLAVDAVLVDLNALYLEKADADEDSGFADAWRVHPHLYEIRPYGQTGLLRVSPAVNLESGDRLTLDANLAPEDFGTKLEDIPLSVAQQCAEAAVAMATEELAGQAGRPWGNVATEDRQSRRAADARRRLNYNLAVGLTGSNAMTQNPIIEG